MEDRFDERNALGFTDVVRLFLKRWKLIVICAVVTAVVFGGVAFAFRKIDVSYGAVVKYGISVYSHRDSDAMLEEKKESHTFESKHLAKIVDELSSGDFTAKIIAELQEIEDSDRKDESFASVVTDRNDPAFNAKEYGNVERKIQSYVTYSFNYTKNPNAISVKVKVPKDKVLAEEILSIVKTDVPKYVEENITVPVSEKVTEVKDGAQVTDWVRFTATCRELSYSYCDKLDSYNDSSKAVSWAVIGGVLGIVIALAIVLFGYKGKNEQDERSAENVTDGKSAEENKGTDVEKKTEE